MTKADPHNKVHPIPSAHTRVALFIFGFLGLSYEVLSSKVFFEYYSESSQSLALILSIFLVGLAVGSLLYAKYNNTLTKPAVFVTLHIATGIFLCFTLIHIDSIILFVQNFISLESVWNQIVVSLIVLLFPTIVLGTVFPRLLATSINASDEKHKPIGNSNALDLAGSVIGSLTVGFLFIPVLGIAHSILVIFILHVLALLLFIERRKGWYLFLIFYVIALVCGSLYEPVQTVVDDHENIV
ncbi:MAG: fused MFS/spermidine synthase, partial [Candidatus Saccharimonadales bacterium]